MRKLIMWNVVTVDGYFEGKQAWDLEFHQVAWGADLEKFIMEQLKSVDMLIFGRNTYQGMADYWTNAAGEPEAKHMNALPKIVCSTTLQKVDWNNTTIVKDAVADIAKLKQAGEGNMFVFGCGELSASLMKAGLFDEYRLCVAPVILGEGRRLFAEGLPYQKLQLLQARQLQSGGVILTYAPEAQ